MAWNEHHNLDIATVEKRALDIAGWLPLDLSEQVFCLCFTCWTHSTAPHGCTSLHRFQRRHGAQKDTSVKYLSVQFCDSSSEYLQQAVRQQQRPNRSLGIPKHSHVQAPQHVANGVAFSLKHGRESSSPYEQGSSNVNVDRSLS